MKSYFLLVFYTFLFFQSHALIEEELESNDYLLLDTSNFSNPVYYIESLPLPNPSTKKMASFCSYEQPKFDLKYFEKVFDQTDMGIFNNEDQLLMIDDKLYVLLSSGVFQVFNITWLDGEESMVFHHYNEIKLSEPNVIKAMNGPFYLKMVYNREYHKIVIVVQEEVIIINIDDKQKIKWLNYQKFSLNSSEPITRVIMYNNYLFALRNNSDLEQFSLSAENVFVRVNNLKFDKIPFLNKYGVVSKNMNVTDFFIDGNYLAFTEKYSENVFLFKINLQLNDLNELNMKNLSLKYAPLKVQMTNSKLFVLLEGQIDIEYFLNEYLLHEKGDLEFNDSYHIDYNYSDFYISNTFLFYSYKDYTTMFPHSFNYPSGLNRRLKITLNVERIREIEHFKVSKEATEKQIAMKNNYYTAAIGDYIGVLKVNLLPGTLICKTKGTAYGDYFMNLRFYQVKCKDVDDKTCNSSEYFTTDELYKIKVTLPVVIETVVTKNEGLLAGLVSGLGCSCLILTFCCLYVRKIKKSYVKYEESKDKGHMRIMSKDEINEEELKITQKV